MKYVSTRLGAPEVSAPQAILKGLAPDGGLYVPTEIPKLDLDLLTADISYEELATRILLPFLPEYKDVLADLTHAAYGTGRFDTTPPTPLKALSDGVYSEELWHGPTSAFKDMALQLMPRLLSAALRLTGEKRDACILTATSGDTGKAALEGFCDVEQTKILVFYPAHGVSPLQKRQMTTQEGNNVRVQAIDGNFDDAQTAVKEIFSDETLADAISPYAFLSSANSINFGRLAPQIVYYVQAYRELLKEGKIRLGDKVNFCVPTGNFGNIFACYLAKQMGLPVGKLICASNTNNVLTDFLNTGVYDKNRAFTTTISPSMDILVSSNLERLLYFVFGGDRTKALMNALKTDGKYALTEEERTALDADFYGAYCSEEETRRTIKSTFEDEGYLVDPHTAVGLFVANEYRRATGDQAPIVCGSTASAYKFPQSVLDALGIDVPDDEFEALTRLSEATGTPIPAPLAALKNKTVRFESVIGKDALSDAVEQFVRR